MYYEVDLPSLIEQGDAEAFKYFWLFFHSEAFVAQTFEVSETSKVSQAKVSPGCAHVA